MKKKLSKLSEALGTAFQYNQFFTARIKIMLLYITSMIIVLIIFNAILTVVRTQQIEENIYEFEKTEKEFVTVSRDIFASKLVEDLNRNSILVSVALLLISGIFAYIIAGKTLKPLKENSETQRRFINDASHELRTPLAVLKTNFEVALLDKDMITREEALRVLEYGVKNIDRFSSILNNILVIAGVQKNAENMPMSAIAFDRVIHHVLRLLKTRIAEKNIISHEDISDALCVWGNDTALEQVVINVIKNAIIYSPHGGNIYITAATHTREAVFSVEDTGPGILPEDMPYIFEPFFRGKLTKVSLPHERSESAGLGLAIARNILQHHHGHIYAESVPGAGTKMTITIPLAT